MGNIPKGRDQGKSTVAVFLDLSKAFDTISHSVLFKKLDDMVFVAAVFSGLQATLKTDKCR